MKNKNNMPQFNYIRVKNTTPNLRTIYNFIKTSINTYAVQCNWLYTYSLDGGNITFTSVCKLHWTKYHFSDFFCTIEIETIFVLQLF